MADQELKLTANLNASGVEEGAKKGGDALDGLKSKAGAQGVGKGFDESKTAVDRLNAAVEKLSKAESPRALIRGAAELEGQLEKVRATAGTIGPDLAASMQRAEAAIASAIPKAGQMADRLADTRRQAGLAAESYKTLGAAGGGLTGVFSLMDDAGKGWVSTLGKVGLASLGVVQALELAKTVGTGLGEALAHVADHWDDQRMAMQKAATEAIKYDAAMRLVHRGLIEQGSSYEELIRNMERWTIAQGRHKQGAQELADKYGITIPQSVGSAKEALGAFTSILAGAYKRSVDEGNRTLLENGEVLKKWAAIVGKDAPAAVQAYLGRLTVLTSETQKLKASQLELAASYLTAATAAKTSMESAQAAVITSVDTERRSLKELNQALQDGTISLDKHSEEKKRILAEGTASFIAASDQETTARGKMTESLEKYAAQTISAMGMSDEAVKKVQATYSAFGQTVSGFVQKVADPENFIKFTTNLQGTEKSVDSAKVKLVEGGKGFVEFATEAEKSSEKTVKAWAAAETVLGQSVDRMNAKLDSLARKFREVQTAAAGAGGGDTEGLAGGVPPVGPS